MFFKPNNCDRLKNHDEIQIDKYNNKIKNLKKRLKTNNIMNFKAIFNRFFALSNFICSTLC